MHNGMRVLVLGITAMMLAASAPLGAAGKEVGDGPGTAIVPAELDDRRVKALFVSAIPSDIDDWAESRGGSVVLRSAILKLVAIQLGESVNGDAFLAQLRGRSDVSEAHYDGIVRHAAHASNPLSPNPPNDPRWNDQYGPRLIGAVDAWALEKGSPDVIIAILDTGVHMTHEDLSNPCTPHCGQAGYDVYGHGSHVAGSAAAETNNGKGIAGMAQSKLMAVKALSDAGTSWWTTLAVAIVDATVLGADVLSMSLGGNCNFQGILLCPEVPIAINYSWAQGTVLVAASGNNGANNFVSHPAAFDHVLAVGSVNQNKLRSGFSNGGPQLDLMAPGQAIISSVPSVSVMCGVNPAGYCSVQGTSMATPHVSGVAGLVWSHCPSLTNQGVVDILIGHAEDLGAPGRDDLYGHGLVRADLALQNTPIC